MAPATFWRLTCPSSVFIRDLELELEFTLTTLVDDNSLEELFTWLRAGLPFRRT